MDNVDNKRIYIIQDQTIPGHRIIEELERRGGFNIWHLSGNDSADLPAIYYLKSEGYIDYCTTDLDYEWFINHNYSELRYDSEKDVFADAPAKLKINYVNFGNKIILDIPETCETSIEEEHIILTKKMYVPKFEQTNWVVYNKKTYEITSIALKNYYKMRCIDGTIIVLRAEDVDEKMHLWNVETDAVPGDVIIWNNQYMGIFGHISEDTISFERCTYDIYRNNFYSSKYYTEFPINHLITKPASIVNIKLFFDKLDEHGFFYDKLLHTIEKKKHWTPKENEKFYYIKEIGFLEYEVAEYKWRGYWADEEIEKSFDEYCDYLLKIGNVFRTKEEAEQFCTKVNNAVSYLKEEFNK